jgi:transposase
MLLRYADDFVAAFEYEDEARRFMSDLGERLKKFSLELAAEKACFHIYSVYTGWLVIEKILGSDFAGTVICDFYAAYNCLKKTQRCLVHLLRDIKKEREVLSGSKLLERFDAQVKAFIEKGLEVQAMDEGPEKTKAISQMETRLNRLSTMPVTKGKATTLQKRITKYRDDLIRFVTHPDVEFHNNRAERQLRPLVICRKISFGSNTHEGALRHCIIHSIIETCKLQNQDPSEYMRRAYTLGGLDVPDICSPPAA